MANERSVPSVAGSLPRFRTVPPGTTPTISGPKSQAQSAKTLPTSRRTPCAMVSTASETGPVPTRIQPRRPIAQTVRESAQKNNEFVNLDSSMRLSMVVSAQNEKESFYIARQVFSEAIDLWSVFDSVVVGSVRLVDVAFLVDMSTNKIQPFVREKQLLNSVCLHQTVFFPLTLSQALSAYNNKDEFAIRVKRFCHWLRKSTTEEDNQLRILFLWFSIEALLKENEKDNIAPYVSMLIGFCATKQSSAAWASLRTNEKYREYHRLFADNIEKIRIFRNNSVHSGFVPWDISEEDTYLFYYILHNASIKAASAIRSFYMENSCQRNVSCFKSFLEKSIPLLPNYSNWFNGTFLYGFEKKIFLQDFLKGGSIN